MITKATAKFIKSLQLKKYRQEHQAFLVEGKKNVLELLASSYSIKFLVATPEFIQNHHLLVSNVQTYEAPPKKLSALGTLKSNDAALAVAETISPEDPDWNNIDFAFILDQLNDPGNFGTIIRLADWYGIKHIVVSQDTTDVHNPKVINASKGSYTRVNIYYKDLKNFLIENPKPVVGAYMDGQPVYDFKWPKEGYVIMGNEANGISEGLQRLVDHRITIPRFGEAESLNVAMATAIICDNWKRSSF